MSWNGLANGYRAFADYEAATDISVIVASNLTPGGHSKRNARYERFPNIMGGTYTWGGSVSVSTAPLCMDLR